uniref:Protein SPEC3 n=1 Tax=Syphacia muris TaxID=451379 RepID=A0A0N5A8J1_9BILA
MTKNSKGVFNGVSVQLLVGNRVHSDHGISGWKRVQKALPRIVEYGIEEGILKERVTSITVPGVVFDGTEDAKNTRDQRVDDKVNLPTNDITVMHEAIPFLPVPVALLCLTFNILIPGTILSGICGLCMGQPRINFKEGRKIMTLIVNFLVGVSQFFTITFLFVGWFWSVSWGILIIIHSMQYREALQQRRQEAVATAAIEALTKDSILHRRDVKTLVKTHKNQSKQSR